MAMTPSLQPNVPTADEASPSPSPSPSPLDQMVEQVRRGDGPRVYQALRQGVDPNGIGRLFLGDTVYAQRSPLAQACWMGHITLVDLLLEHGAHPLDGEEMDPASLDVALRLTGEGWPFNATQRMHAFRRAVHRHAMDVMLHHVDQGLDVTQRDDDARTVLHQLAQGFGRDVSNRSTTGAEALGRLVQRLIGQGADVNATDASGHTALHHVLARFTPTNGKRDPSWFEVQAVLVQALLDAGADVNAPGPDGTPLVLAFSRAQHHPVTVQRLLDRGARLGYLDGPTARTEPGSALLGAVYTGIPDLIEQALQRGEPVNRAVRFPGVSLSIAHPTALLPLGRVVRYGQLDLMEKLLDAGADPRLLVNSPDWTDLESRRASLRSPEGKPAMVNATRDSGVPEDVWRERQVQAVDRIERLALDAEATVVRRDALEVNGEASRVRARL